MKVQDVMTKTVRPVAPGDDLATAAMVLWDHDCGAAPVVDEAGKVVGVITDRDICMAAATKLRSPVEITVGEVASGEVHTCRPEDDLTEAHRAMREGRVRRLPVVDEGGALQGILSINDLVLRAGEGGGEKTPGLTHQDVVSTLRAVSEHRTEYLGEAQAAAAGGHPGAG
jgi:CBS domain-containing protein